MPAWKQGEGAAVRLGEPLASPVPRVSVLKPSTVLRERSECLGSAGLPSALIRETLQCSSQMWIQALPRSSPGERGGGSWPWPLQPFNEKP